jgi:hypothetical protein
LVQVLCIQVFAREPMRSKGTEVVMLRPPHFVFWRI